MKIKVFAHWVAWVNATSIATEQLNRLKHSGLLDTADVFFVCITGDPSVFLDNLIFLQDYKNVRIVTANKFIEFGEYPTLDILKKQCDVDTEDHAVFYHHLKGVSRQNGPATDWRRFLEYWNIDNWRACVESLEQGHDTVGVNYTKAPEGNKWPHYSGNFWWARSSYIAKLKPLPDPTTIKMGTPSEFTEYIYNKQNFRFDHEAWIGTGQPNYFEISQSPGKDYTGFHYHNLYPEYLYKL